MRAVGWEFKKARNLFIAILRDPSYDDASCVALLSGLIATFLWQVEPLLWSRGIFRVLETYEGEFPPELTPFSLTWLFPFGSAPSIFRDNLWILVAIVYLVNAVLLDRFLAKHGGNDGSFRSPILSLRKLLAGVPVLGLSVLPLWRILCNHKWSWACRHAVARPVMEGNQPELSLLSGGAYLHSALLIFWLMVSNVLALRAGLAWLGPAQATATDLLVVQGICGGLRIVGLACTLAYVCLRRREGILWGNRMWIILLSSGSWVLPQSLFLLGILSLIVIGERSGTMVSDARNLSSSMRPEVDGPFLSAISRPLRLVELDRGTLKLLRLYREKTFLLMLEVASTMMLVIPLRERFPFMVLPGCLVSLLSLLALLLLPVGLIFYARSLLRVLSETAGQAYQRKKYPFACYLLLTSVAVVMGYVIGAQAGIRDLTKLASILFWTGSYGVVGSSVIAFIEVVKRRDYSQFVWPLLFLSIGMTGYEMQHGSSSLFKLGIGSRIEDVARFYLFKLYLMIPLVFLLTVLVGLYRSRWLLRPFRIKDIFNPILPTRLRRRLAFLAVTACLPLGGFLVPVWIRLRARLEEHPLPA